MGTVVQLWFQAKMYRTAAAILLLCGLVQSYPSGAPSCTSTPGHGTNNGQVCAVVKDIGNDKWEVHVAAFHKGLVINAETAGQWDASTVNPNYQVMDTCVTHVNPDQQNNVSITFETEGSGTPEFSGFLVYDFDSYASIVFQQNCGD